MTKSRTERNWTTPAVAVGVFLFAVYGTHRVLNDDYEASFERNLRRMSLNVVECVRSKRLVNTAGPIPACYDPVNGATATVDVAALPPAAVPPASPKEAKASGKQAQARPKVSPMVFQRPRPVAFRMPEREGPMPAFEPAPQPMVRMAKAK